MQWRKTIRALATCWLILLATTFAAYVVMMSLIAARLISMEWARRVIRERPGTGVFHEAVSSGIPESLVFMMFNGTGTLIIWIALLWSVRLSDPAPTGRFSRVVKWIQNTDRAFRWFWPFDKKVKENLRSIYFDTFLYPFIFPVVIGIFAGGVIATFSYPHDLLRSAFRAFFLIVPHGIFELSATILPGALIRVIFLEIRNDILSGDEDTVSADIRRLTSCRVVLPWAILAGLFVVIAAFIEAHGTVPLADAVSEAVGMPY